MTILELDPAARSTTGDDPAGGASFLAATVGEPDARRLFDHGSRLARTWRTLLWSGRSRDDASLELVRLPVALSWIGNGRDSGARSNEKARDRVLLYVVERILGHAWVVSIERAAVAAAEATASAGDRDGEVDDRAGALPARLARADCFKSLEALAFRGGLVSRSRRVADLSRLEPLRAASYPLWLRYRSDRRGRLDFDALDAITGRRAGGPIRSAVAAALIDADRLLASR